MGGGLSSKIIILDLKNLDSETIKNKDFIIFLYTANNKKIIKKEYSGVKSLSKFEEGVPYTIFKEIKNLKTICLLSVYSEYGRFYAIQKSLINLGQYLRSILLTS